MIDLSSLPLGFGVALAKNESAMNNFKGMSDDEQRVIIDRSKDIGSRDEMILFVNGLGESKFIK